jgi:hypothetical protein
MNEFRCNHHPIQNSRGFFLSFYKAFNGEGNKGNVSVAKGGPNKDSFTPIKQRNIGRCHKQAYKDR